MVAATGFVSNRFLTASALVKSPSFSKDAEIAEKAIEFATNGLSLRENSGVPSEIDLAALSFGCSAPARAAQIPGLTIGADAEFDGYFIGANGRAFEPLTKLDEIPACTPPGGARNDETLIYLNGISATRARQANSLQLIAEATGSPTIGIYNAAQSGLLDVAQSSGEKFDLGKNPAVDTLAETIYSQLRAGRVAHLLAYSQGAIVTSRALQDVSNRFRLEDGCSKREAEDLLSRLKVETFGGAAHRYPDGPKYVHYINRKDFVPRLFGLRDFLNPLMHRGEGAVTRYFNAGKGFLAHNLEDIYLGARVPFEAARSQNFAY